MTSTQKWRQQPHYSRVSKHAGRPITDEPNTQNSENESATFMSI